MTISHTKMLTPTKHRFFNPAAEEGYLYSFSTDLEKIGLEWDVQIQNGAFIEVISEPLHIQRPKYGGMISVTKIRADVAQDYHTILKEFWIPTVCIQEVKDERQVPLVH
jgi:hypothetical protein